MTETGKNFCPSKDGVDNLGKSGKAWGKTYTKELNVSGTADIQGLRVNGKADIQTLGVSGFTGILPIAHGGTGTDSLANVTVGKAGTLDGDAGLWDYLHRLGVNPTLPTTNAALNALGVFMSYFTQKDKIANQPTQYGQLLNIPADKGAESAQLWIEHHTGKMSHRGGNSATAINDTPFTRFLDTDDLSAAGVVAGDVSNADAWWVKLGGAVPLIIQGGNSSITGGVVYPISFSSFGLPFAITNGEVPSANIIIHAGSNNVSGFGWGSSVGNSSTSILWTSIGI